MLHSIAEGGVCTMMKISGDFYIKCNNCGQITLVETDGLDYDTSVYERSMGEEIEYDSW